MRWSSGREPGRRGLRSEDCSDPARVEALEVLRTLDQSGASPCRSARRPCRRSCGRVWSPAGRRRSPIRSRSSLMRRVWIRSCLRPRSPGTITERGKRSAAPEAPLRAGSAVAEHRPVPARQQRGLAPAVRAHHRVAHGVDAAEQPAQAAGGERAARSPPGSPRRRGAGGGPRHRAVDRRSHRSPSPDDWGFLRAYHAKGPNRPEFAPPHCPMAPLRAPSGAPRAAAS